MAASAGTQVAVIGGDGIGPEVTAEALKVVRAAGVELETTDFDLGAARYLRDGDVLSDETLAELRGYDAILPRRRRAGHRRHADPHRDPRAGPAAQDALRARPVHQPAALPRRPRARSPRAPTSWSSARTPRAPTPARAASCARHAPRDRHPGLGQHPLRRRALRALRLRPGGQPPERKQLTLVHKTNVLTFAGDLWQRSVQRGRRRVPRRRRGLQPRRRRLHLPGRATRSATT